LENTFVRMTEFKKCEKDFYYFLTNYWKVISYCNRVETIKPSKYQRHLIRLSEKVSRMLINTARKSGVTTMFVARVVWLMLFKPGFIAVVTGPSKIIAKEFIDKAFYSYSKLPEELKIGIETKTPFILEFSNGSKLIIVSPEPQIAVRADFIMIDAAAFIPDLKELQTSLIPTLNPKGCMITSSTLYKDSEFLAQCVAAREGNYDGEYIEVYSSISHLKTGKWMDKKVSKLGKIKAKVETQPCYYIQDKQLTHINNWEGDRD